MSRIASIADIRAAILNIAVEPVSIGKIDGISFNLVAHLIQSDALLAESIVGMVMGDIAPEYRYGHLAPIAAKWLTSRHGVGDNETILAIVDTVIKLTVANCIDDPAVLERLLSEDA